MGLGRAAEEVVAHYLSAAGFTVLGRNLRLRYLELDVVARYGELIVVVEVRHRGPRARTTAFGSLSPLKRQRLRRAARALWARYFRRAAGVSRLRIDAAIVHFPANAPPQVEYCPGAITLDAG